MVFFKTGWKNLYINGNSFRKELPMVCLGCMHFYTPDNFRRHVIHVHNSGQPTLTSQMRKFVFTKVVKNKVVKRTKNNQYESVFKDWKSNGGLSKDGNFSSLTEYRLDKEVLSAKDFVEKKQLYKNNIFNNNIGQFNQKNNHFNQKNGHLNNNIRKLNQYTGHSDNNMGEFNQKTDQSNTIIGHFNRKKRRNYFKK